MNGKQKFFVLMGFFQLFLVAIVVISVQFFTTTAVAATSSNTFQYYNSPTTSILAISSAVAVAASVIGSAWTIRTVGTSAIAALTEREEAFFKAFLIVALGEALAVYGLIIAILLWTKIPSPV